MARCDALATCSEETGRITRPYGTPSLVSARALLANWMQQAGMDFRFDAIGTLCGRYAGTRDGAPALLFGSHFDSVRDAGKYDGPLGILVAIAAVERLAQRGEVLPFPLEIVAFPDEEGLRFQTTYLGSTALAGTFDLTLLDRTDAAGITLREAIATFGGDPDALPTATIEAGEAFAYIEVHIEQGPFLESVAAPLGVVTAISGQTRLLATFTGEAGHAGTVAMHLRRDPVPAAAELALAAESLARATPGLLATTGAIQVEPGVSNVIPGSVQISLDVRHPEDAPRQHAVRHLEQHARSIAAARNLGLEWELVRDHPAVQCDAALVSSLSAAVTRTGQPLHLLPSGAGHDAVMVASCVPVGMLFVRCAGGISHNPAESVTTEDVAAAIAAIDGFVDELAKDERP